MAIKLEKNLRLRFTWKGKRYQVTTKFKPGQEKQAAKLLAAILFDLENNRFRVDFYRDQIKRPNVLMSLDINYIETLNNPLMSALLEEQLSIYQSKMQSGCMAVSTIQMYGYTISAHLLPRFGKLKVNDIDTKMIESFINSLGFTKRRIVTILRPMQEIYKRLIRQGVIRDNPLLNIDKDSFITMAKSDYEVDPFSQSEINQILENCEHECVRNFVQFGFWTGMRIGEIFALEWSDIDFDKELIIVNKTQTIKQIVKAPKTRAGIRRLEMTPLAKDALLRQIELTGKDQDKRVFKTPTGKIWYNPDHFGRYWRTYLTKAHVKYRNPYQMRHTFISMMLQFGNSPVIIYPMVGHENTEMIYKRYARFIKQEENKKLLKI